MRDVNEEGKMTKTRQTLLQMAGKIFQTSTCLSEVCLRDIGGAQTDAVSVLEYLKNNDNAQGLKVLNLSLNHEWWHSDTPDTDQAQIKLLSELLSR